MSNPAEERYLNNSLLFRQPQTVVDWVRWVREFGVYLGEFLKTPGQRHFKALSGAPTAEVADGDVYYDSGTNKLRVRAGGAWVDLH